jgi:hypothetical protein
MANKPVFGIQKCPYCGHKVPLFWNGNFTAQCPFCRKHFKAKRQKLTDVKPYSPPKKQKWEVPEA